MKIYLIIFLIAASFVWSVMSRGFRFRSRSFKFGISHRRKNREKNRGSHESSPSRTYRGYCYVCEYPQDWRCKGPNIDKRFSKKCPLQNHFTRCMFTKRTQTTTLSGNSFKKVEIIRECAPSNATKSGCEVSTNGQVETRSCYCNHDNCNSAAQRAFMSKLSILMVFWASFLGLNAFWDE